MGVIRFLIGITVVALLSAVSALAGDHEDGVAAYNRRDYAAAFQSLQPS